MILKIPPVFFTVCQICYFYSSNTKGPKMFWRGLTLFLDFLPFLLLYVFKIRKRWKSHLSAQFRLQVRSKLTVVAIAALRCAHLRFFYIKLSNLVYGQNIVLILDGVFLSLLFSFVVTGHVWSLYFSAIYAYFSKYCFSAISVTFLKIWFFCHICYFLKIIFGQFLKKKKIYKFWIKFW